MSEVRGWSAGTTRRSALLLTVCVLASLVLLQKLAVSAGIIPEASWLPALVGTCLVLVAAVVGHLMIGAGRRYMPVPPGLVPQLDLLTSQAGITRVPEFVVNPRALTTGAVTRGRTGRYRLMLDAGLVCRQERGPERFTAVVLHELAHVRNRDVEVAQLTVALWRVTSLAVLLPYVLVNTWAYGQGPDRAGALRNIELALAVSAVLYLMYAEVLRVRELYADRDAVSWGADREQWAERDEPDLPDTVPALLLLLGRLLLRGTATRFATLLRTHPTPDQRRRALGDPDSWAASSMVNESIFSLLLTGAAGAMVILLAGRVVEPGGPTEWPAGLKAVVVYPAVVVCLAALLASPSRRYQFTPVRYAPVAARHRRRAVLVVTVIFGAVLALLYAFDPVHLRSDQAPKHLPWPHMRPPPAPTTWPSPTSPTMVEMNRAWYRRGGWQAQTQLDMDLIDLGENLEASPLRHIDWGSFATDCTAVSRDVDAVAALGDFPYEDGRQPWSVLKNQSRAAVDVLCHHRYPAREYQPLFTAAQDIARAQEASRTVRAVLIHYLSSR